MELHSLQVRQYSVSSMIFSQGETWYYIAINYMIKLATRPVRKVTHVGWLSRRAISFSTIRQVMAGKCLSRFEDKQTRFRYVLQNINNYKLQN